MNQTIAHTALHKRSSQAADRARRLTISVVALELTKWSTRRMHDEAAPEEFSIPPSGRIRYAHGLTQ